MYTYNDYFYGWLVYVAAALILILCAWWLTSGLRWREPRQLLRLMVTVTLLLPWYTDADMKFFAPAWVMAVFEWVFEHNFWRAGGPLLMALIAAVALAMVLQLSLRYIGRSKPAPVRRYYPKR
jgi:hypothetical protein